MRDLRAFVMLGLMAGLAACGGRNGPPAPVVQHGDTRPALSRAESATGAVVVQQGETLYAISRRTGVALRALIDTNGLQAPYRLQAGQRLALPGRAVAAAPVPSGTPAPPPPVPRTSVESAPIAPPAPSSGAAVPQQATAPTPSGQSAPSGPSVPTGAAPVAGPGIAAVPPVPPPAPGGAAGAPPSAAPVASGAPSAPVAEAPRPTASAPAAVPGAEEPAAAATRPPPAVDTPAPARAARSFLWPLRGTIISTYGSKTGGLQNDGINIAAARGTPVRAAENGVVVYAGNELKGFGNLLLLRHADGWMSAYAHLDEIQVERGQTVQRGQAIGKLGQTGGVTSPQLHFELRRGGKAVDPRGHLAPLQTAQAE
ncbi:MAG: peptidoglycan DD-metalloendopeptidase family protein [Alphaproteobacteria bacterium]|nr:peptidoglycan DD-metalloendopeptidase family protein [Alphaproteobacteria bacterium]